MRIAYLALGLLIGGLSSFVLTKSFYQTTAKTHSDKPNQNMPGTSPTALNRRWADSMDAVKAAPASHKVVYEDSTVRVLQVVLEANKTEPIHTHQWKSIMWFTQATPMRYYKYDFKNNRYTVGDSITIPQMPLEVLNRGDVVDTEGPHAVKNLSSRKGIAYRVEFKKEFKP